MGTTMLNLNTAIISSMPVPTPTPTTRAYIELAITSTREVPALRAEIAEMHRLRAVVRDELLKGRG